MNLQRREPDIWYVRLFSALIYLTTLRLVIQQDLSRGSAFIAVAALVTAVGSQGALLKYWGQLGVSVLRLSLYFLVELIALSWTMFFVVAFLTQSRYFGFWSVILVMLGLGAWVFRLQKSGSGLRWRGLPVKLSMIFEVGAIYFVGLILVSIYSLALRK